GGRDLVVRRRVLRVVGLERPAAAVRGRPRQRRAVGGRALRQVEELVRSRLVALLVLGALLAGPRLDLRAREDGSADRVVGDEEACGAAVADAGGERDAADPEPGDQAGELALSGPVKRPGHVAAPGG